MSKPKRNLSGMKWGGTENKVLQPNAPEQLQDEEEDIGGGEPLSRANRNRRKIRESLYLQHNSTKRNRNRTENHVKSNKAKQ